MGWGDEQGSTCPDDEPDARRVSPAATPSFYSRAGSQMSLTGFWAGITRSAESTYRFAVGRLPSSLESFSIGDAGGWSGVFGRKVKSMDPGSVDASRRTVNLLPSPRTRTAGGGLEHSTGSVHKTESLTRPPRLARRSEPGRRRTMRSSRFARRAQSSFQDSRLAARARLMCKLRFGV